MVSGDETPRRGQRAGRSQLRGPEMAVTTALGVMLLAYVVVVAGLAGDAVVASDGAAGVVDGNAFLVVDNHDLLVDRPV
jgi:hypothetical protein